MLNYNKKTNLLIIITLSFFSIIIAYFIEIVLGYQPCSLCKIERIPYILSILVIFFYIISKKNLIFLSVLLLLIFGFSVLISLYHLGIEQGLIEESSVCGDSNNSQLITKEALLKSFEEIRVSCKDVTFKLFGLSLTTYNVLLSIVIFFLSLKIYVIENGK